MNSNYLAALAEWLETNGVGTRGQDIFIGEAPREVDESGHAVPAWWLVAAGGAPEGTDYNMWKRGLSVSVFRRDTTAQSLFDQFENLSNIVANAAKDCITMDGYEVIKMEVISELIDSDVDSEENKIGVMVIKLTVRQI